jgi:patatin-related protein
MREKELRLALICYGGISLAVYMHGITKEIWRLVRASRAFHAGDGAIGGSEQVYHGLLETIERETGVRVRVLADIIAGASAGGINGIFLAQAIASGQSLDPLTNLWLEGADVDRLLDPDARPLSRFSKVWATPIAWMAAGKRGGTIEKTVALEARDEVRTKLSRFVRARWFEPPFGGDGFTAMLLDAFDAMAQTPAGLRLLPDDQPLDLFVTVTDFHGHREKLRLNSPREIDENEHRLTLSYGDGGREVRRLGAAADLTFAARATASFPGAFPPFTVTELDRVLAERSQAWPGREAFLSHILPRQMAEGRADKTVLIDGSVLANAPFRPAIEALRDRPARREVDRRFVYIDPKPGRRSVSLTKKDETALPGFFGTIFGALSDIPREQPIRDNLEAIEARSARIRRMQRIIDALRPEVESSIQTLFGRTLFLDRPNASRLKAWRNKAQDRAARDAGHAYYAYGHVKLSGVVEEIIGLIARINPASKGEGFEALRQSIWTEIRARGLDQIGGNRGGANPAAIAFFRSFDLGFRIRRLRFLIRTLSSLSDQGEAVAEAVQPVRVAIYAELASYLDREAASFYGPIDPDRPGDVLDTVETLRDLPAIDAITDARIAEALAACPKAERRVLLLAYLGFPYYDIATLPLLQGEGLDEFDPIRVDRIAPEDATTIRPGGAAATLKGIQFNNFGAFFSRAYRENDYLWGRLHGADRLIDIVVSTLPASARLPAAGVAAAKRAAFHAILDEEEARLTSISALFVELRREIDQGPLASAAASA